MHFVKSFFDVANQSAAAALNRKIIEISLRNFNSGLDLGKSLAGARNPFEVVTLVASFWWKQSTNLDFKRRSFKIGYSDLAWLSLNLNQPNLCRTHASASLPKIQLPF
jgi:hypothetical protein